MIQQDKQQAETMAAQVRGVLNGFMVLILTASV